MGRYLASHQDAFGQSLLDRFHGQDAVEVVERRDGFVSVAPDRLQYFRTSDEWPAHERKAAALAFGRVLDVGCGAGRFALALQDQGCDVVAIDVSPGAVAVSRLRGVRDARELALADVGAELSPFDAILMMGNNFGVLENPGRARRLLRRLHRLSTPHALILAEILDPYRTEEPLHLAYHESNRRRGRMPGQVRIRVLYKNLRTPWFDYLFVSPEELTALLRGTGWRVRERLESDGSAYVAVLEKEEA